MAEKKNPEYDFKWCPGCGDFGVKKALEAAIKKKTIETEEPILNNVLIAGIGCSGNMVHLLEGEQPYGFHGLHGRTLPVAMGLKSSRPDLNVIVVAGDGDFLSIGAEHIAPQAKRNLDVCVVIMDNAVYGLTKGQSSPTSEEGMITSSTPYGKTEQGLDPLAYYLSLGISFVASGLSSKIKDLSELIYEGMIHPGFSIVHVQSPCTEYNNTYEILKGSPKKGIEPLAKPIDESHNPNDLKQAMEIVDTSSIPLGILYQSKAQPTLTQRFEDLTNKSKQKDIESLLKSYSV